MHAPEEPASAPVPQMSVPSQNKCEEALLRVVASDPTNPRAYIALLEFYHKTGQASKAAQVASILQQLVPVLKPKKPRREYGEALGELVATAVLWCIGFVAFFFALIVSKSVGGILGSLLNAVCVGSAMLGAGVLVRVQAQPPHAEARAIGWILGMAVGGVLFWKLSDKIAGPIF